MKTQFVLMLSGIFISLAAFSQDTTLSDKTKNQVIFKNEPQVHVNVIPAQPTNEGVSEPIYRDTRLGSSSPLYNTYQKNDNGAGAITNDPYKIQGGGINIMNQPPVHLHITQPVYHDSRLGSSSPLYNTYEKNNNGAGAITNDPNKGQGGVPVLIPAVADTLKK